MSDRETSTSSGCREFRRSSRLSRRQVLQAGSLSALGLGWGELETRLALAQSSSQNLPQKRAKACIFLFMWGGPSQLDTFDLKPNAPAEVRGSFNPISTKVPGTQICEHFTGLASMTDKVAIIRSLTHDDPAHLSSGHATLTGQLAPVVKSDADPPSAKDSPHLGAIVSKLRPSTNGLPSFVAMPWKAYHPAAPGGEAPGQHGGWLGSAHDGMLLNGDLNDPNWHPQGLSLPADIGLDRLESRVELLKTLDRQRATLQHSLGASSYGSHQSRAMEMIGSSNVRSAFDLTQESDATRERYGRNIHGQCILMARRLVEHGVPLISVNWHNDGKNFWDTHGDNFNRLKNDLIPPADRALSALLTDLEERGLLDETIVAWVGEFGRKPQITAANAGREHWPFCYSGLLAGGGIRPGMVYGSSDKHAAYPASDPVTPQDFATTILHAMGLPTETALLDREERPHRITSGRVLHELLV
ncbi:DUF1501 domain-containing protein [Allorhodopirellula heiligendammensis]|uniref:Sulfatase n=1 Tax=Allorhodopirellula heiligendammensis TaxID=2714739 RepID=A0A5C6BDU0_9BACT|nr:DUF1501 domain-containing protein [Allorhodopirellula heiligendammensis]TWU10140.1 hypothetical protein Poly21_51090 [Allorhodopirellula heiligendammensis]